MKTTYAGSIEEAMSNPIPPPHTAEKDAELKFWF